MSQLSNQELENVLRNSECLITTAEVNAAYDKLAAQLNLHYAGLNPIVMVVMNGGLIPAGQLLTKLFFFHRMEYIHATRYRDNQGTDDLQWKMRPNIDLRGEHVLLIDDIFDEGYTLKAIVDELSQESPATLNCCVLLNKNHDRKVPNFKADFIGREVVDRYIYGCGMDYHGYLRHLPGIYALKEDKEPSL
ncbi:hypoxanthine-guanine phosphoribosyltransferase [Suttonella sp. R2A3]|uniref:hypoxanthine-guanine phosphoribosyltransferase n=1 Tax=Suttonella sp. R2A3 TaxID=2908648 RepID=UPI001F21E39E|nr:hypoxanthine-guanine phosphoribosyltransferase [Suttonella sp. R2A3]UJF24963.1 hypoxanthine-guanine phosphoribosyltransferase [Suttonella sp. R2A3]